MAELQEIRLGSKLILQAAVGDKLMGWATQATSSINPKVIEFVDAAGITGSVETDALNELYNTLVIDNLIDKLHALYPFVGGTETAHSYNLLATASYQIDFENASFWTHDSNGITGDGTNAWAKTNFSSYTNWTTDSSLGVYSRTAGSNGYDMGASKAAPGGTGAQSAVIAKLAANDNFYPGLPVNNLQYSGSHSGQGLYIASKSGSAQSGSIDGVGVISQGYGGTFTQPGYPISIAAFTNEFGTQVEYSDRNYALAFIGKGLTSDEQSNLYTAVQTYQTALGREVTNIPDLPTNTLAHFYDASDVTSYPGSGSVWSDIQGSTDITLSGTYAYNSSPTGHIDFDGTSGKGDFGSTISLDEFTLSTWFKLDTATLNTIVGGVEFPTSNPQGKILFQADGDVQFRADVDGDSVREDIGFDTGSMLSEWHMLTVKRDSSNNVYMLLDNGTWVTGSQTITETFEIEEIADSANTGQFLDGGISNMLIYTSSLSDNEVLDIYAHYNGNF